MRLKPAVTASSAVRRTTRADASLSRLSPSRTVIRRCGSPSRLPIAVAATASVGLTTAPRATPAANETPGTSRCTTAPTASADTTTRVTESQVIMPKLRRRSMTGTWTAVA